MQQDTKTTSKEEGARERREEKANNNKKKALSSRGLVTTHSGLFDSIQNLLQKERSVEQAVRAFESIRKKAAERDEKQREKNSPRHHGRNQQCGEPNQPGHCLSQDQCVAYSFFVGIVVLCATTRYVLIYRFIFELRTEASKKKALNPLIRVFYLFLQSSCTWIT